MFCLFHFPDDGGSMFVHGLDLLGPAGENPHVIGTGMEKGPKPYVTSFC